jgi:hypothetical protein
MKLFGVLLIMLGCLGLAYGGIRYTQREKLVDFGSIEATVDRQKAITIPPVVGAVVLIAGIALIMRKDR